MAIGNLALVLHTHLPYVRHPEHPFFLEEDWLYEAITESYIPLLRIFRKLQYEGIPFRICMSITPPLCHMLRDALLQERYVRHLKNLIALAESEVDRTKNNEALQSVAVMYLERFRMILQTYEDWNRDLIHQFAQLQNEGCLEIITCAATHGFLPLMESQTESVRAQILIACAHYRECFGCDPIGIWLPECAYTHRLDPVLQEANLRWFILDSHGLMFGNPRPRYAIYAPVYTPAGPAAFARDRDSNRQVWSAEEGYPGDPAYRDFYRDIGFDLSLDYLRPFLPPDAERKFTGLKYYRITGNHTDKELYYRPWAEAAIEWHASDFVVKRAEQIRKLTEIMNRSPIVLSPFDTELFGHWWFEGPEFLDQVIRKSATEQSVYQLVTPSDYLLQNPTQQISQPSPSSWGNQGYSEVWLNDSNAWIYRHLHEAARRMHQLAQRFKEHCTVLEERALTQLARELLLAQSSDWAFLIKTNTARQYATKRTQDHLLRFNRLYQQLLTGTLDEHFLKNCEWRDNIFPNLDWKVYL